MNNNNLLKNINFAFAIFIFCLPLIISLFHLVGLTFVNYDFLLVIFFLMWIIYFLFYLTKEYRNIKFGNIILILIFAMLFWMILSTITHNALNTYFIIYLTYFCIGITFFTTEKKALLLDIFIVVITLCCIMGFIDPSGQFMPGFNSECYRFSLQFFNPNHAGYVIVLTELLVCGKIVEKRKYIYLLPFVILAFYIFFNCSFGSITAIFLGLIIYFIYYWCVRKTFPIDMLLLLLAFMFIGAIIEGVPVLSNFRYNTQYGYYTECASLFDRVFGTNILQDMATIDVGSGRGNLFAVSIQNIGEAPIFGKGCGFSEEFRPHNEFFFVSLDFGLIAGVLYLTIPIMIMIKNFKANPTLSIAIIGYLFSGMFGNITSHTFVFVVAFMGLLANKKDT